MGNASISAGSRRCVIQPSVAFTSTPVAASQRWHPRGSTTALDMAHDHGVSGPGSSILLTWTRTLSFGQIRHRGSRYSGVTAVDN
jgi:hypothetical protein